MALLQQWADEVVNLDKLTYAGNLENLLPVAQLPGYKFLQADICDGQKMDEIFSTEKPDAIIHFAAESHVDRSIHSPAPVILTNFNGTFALLEAAGKIKFCVLSIFLPMRFMAVFQSPLMQMRIIRFAPVAPILLPRPVLTCWRFLTTRLTR